jgi:hypothetical protein
MSANPTEFERAAQAIHDRPIVNELETLNLQINNVLYDVLEQMRVKLFDLGIATKVEVASMFSMVASHFSLENITNDMASDYLSSLRTLVTQLLNKASNLVLTSTKAEYRRFAYSATLLGRSLAYRAEDQPMFVLPKPNFDRDVRGHRGSKGYSCIAARMLWLEQRMRNKIELYPEGGRYAQLLLEHGSLRARLSQHAREEYLDVSTYQYHPSEWVLFLEMVVYLTYCRFDLPRFLDRVEKGLDMRSLPFEEPQSDSQLQTGNNDGSDTISLSSEPTFATLPPTYPALSTFTTPCTNEAMAANDPKDRYCYACTYDYGPVFSHTHKTEPAVRTLCNHVHGTSCLEQGCKAGRSKCPLQTRLVWN